MARRATERASRCAPAATSTAPAPTTPASSSPAPPTPTPPSRSSRSPRSCPRDKIPPVFYALVDEHDTDPIGKDLLATPEGEQLAWFNQRPGLHNTEQGFRAAVEQMRRLLTDGIDDTEREQVRRNDLARRRKAIEGVVALYDRAGNRLDRPEDPSELPVRRGALALAGKPRVAVVQSAVWGFDVWYRTAPVVVSHAARIAKVTVGCPDLDTAVRLFGPDGLMHAWRALGKGWGGRETIGGSPRGVRLGQSEADRTAIALLDLLMA
ncbi:MAG: hypothetical protein H6705_07065 [Myxococcales bacterium]|nr:hypothetical protein [Myxococcales bacterium]